MNSKTQSVFKKAIIMVLIVSMSLTSTYSYGAEIKMSSSMGPIVRESLMIDNVSSYTTIKEPENSLYDSMVDPFRGSDGTLKGTAIGKVIEYGGKAIGSETALKRVSENMAKKIVRLSAKTQKAAEKLDVLVKTKVFTKAKTIIKHTKPITENLNKASKLKTAVQTAKNKVTAIKGLKYLGKGVAVIGMIADGEALFNGKYNHKHSSMKFVRDAMLGANIAINGFLVGGGDKMPGAEILGFTVGLSKDFIASKTFANIMNKQNGYIIRKADGAIDVVNGGTRSLFEFGIRIWNQATGHYASEVDIWIAEQRLAAVNKGRKNGETVGAYKPNIYLYPEEETPILVTFKIPELLEVVIPEYPGEWRITGFPDGTIVGADGEEYTYLFYESITWPYLFQTQEGWMIKAETRSKQMEDIMYSYGFNKEETADFVDYWTIKLESGIDYVMYPQLTSRVDIAMPMDINPMPDTLFRLWFAFDINDDELITPNPETLRREGFTVVEWGGVILCE